MIKISRLTEEERKEYGWLKLDLSINIFGNKLRFNTKKKEIKGNENGTGL